jgi:predicted ATP-dependent serine protease
MSGQGELKSGTELEHHCDTIMVLAYPKDDSDEDVPQEKDVRVLAGSKNRVGLENQKAFFKMNEEGRLEHIPPRSRLIEEPRRKYARRGDEN